MKRLLSVLGVTAIILLVCYSLHVGKGVMVSGVCSRTSALMSYCVSPDLGLVFLGFMWGVSGVFGFGALVLKLRKAMVVPDEPEPVSHP